MRGPYVPNYALDLGQLVAVWGGGKIAPTDDWRGLLSNRQRDVMEHDVDGMEELLRGVAAGRLRSSSRRTRLNIGHAIEVWASWLGDRVEFISDSPWADTNDDTDVEALEWLERHGVDLDVGSGRSPWPAEVPVENPIVRIVRCDELRPVHAQLVSIADDVPVPMRRAHAALAALHEERVRDGLDLVELNWT